MSIILGLNFGHDGSVCLVKDGKLEFAITTERLTKVKKQHGFTDEVIRHVLESTNTKLDDIDCVATNDFKQEVFGNEYLVDTFNVLGKEIKTYIISHHMAHCASAYYTSPFKQAHCFSMDCSMGKLEANSLIAYGEGNKITAEYCPGEMVGVLYGEVTEKLGLGPALHKAGTTMGLASYGTPFNFDYQSYTDDIKHKMNVAASVQNLFENKVLNILNGMEQRSDNLCLSGGSFLNCNANSKVVKHSKFKNFHHFPACGDDGTAVGSALYVAHNILGESRYNYETQDLCYTGRENQVKTPDYEYIAKQIADGKIIGFFQGRSEFGPRALGNRSILADPRNFHNRELINHVVKNREWFRPFAPVVLEEFYQDWFDFPIPSPYMLYTAQVKQPEKIPAVTHVDGSARFQTVNEKTNKHYYGIIKEFGRLTGVPVLLNTSLNGNGQPILETEEDAKEFFKNSNLDLMVINGTILGHS
jgi:carbamoyltransferase